MKIEKEIIEVEPGRSFKIFSPSLRNRFYWHYHPEVELVYVEAINGIRHVGKHISGYVGSDLVLIGSNVPHLNFDYGIQTDYKQIVVQLKVEWVQQFIPAAAELQPIQSLVDKSFYGLAFGETIKAEVLPPLKAMKDMPPLNAMLTLLDILQALATTSDVTTLNEEDTSVRFFLNDKIRMGTIYDYIHNNYNRQPDVNAAAELVYLSTPAFCRYFKKQTNITFTDFVNQYRINQAKTLLLHDSGIGEVCYQVGFESLSYFNKLFKSLTGETPTGFKKKYARR